MERNIIEIRHGQSVPRAGDLEPYELGFCEKTEALYIGASEESEDPILIGKGGGGGGTGTDGKDGATFYPAVSSDGYISWTNDQGLDNPTPVNIKGTDGYPGVVVSDNQPDPYADGTRPVWINPEGGPSGDLYQEIFKAVYPVGSIYLSYNHTSPAELFGGSWVRISNCFLWAVDDEGTIGITGGERTHTLTVNEMPSHTHYLYNENSNSSESANYEIFYKPTAKGYAGTLKTQPAGGGAAHNNMPPYMQVSMWRRTA